MVNRRMEGGRAGKHCAHAGTGRGFPQGGFVSSVVIAGRGLAGLLPFCPSAAYGGLFIHRRDLPAWREAAQSEREKRGLNLEEAIEHV
jgi:hypothetical protein